MVKNLNWICLALIAGCGCPDNECDRELKVKPREEALPAETQDDDTPSGHTGAAR